MMVWNAISQVFLKKKKGYALWLGGDFAVNGGLHH